MLKKWPNFQNSVTHKAKDSISGYSYKGDYYHETVAAYLDQLEKWPKPRLDEANSFVSF